MFDSIFKARELVAEFRDDDFEGLDVRFSLRLRRNECNDTHHQRLLSMITRIFLFCLPRTAEGLGLCDGVADYRFASIALSECTLPAAHQNSITHKEHYTYLPSSLRYYCPFLARDKTKRLHWDSRERLCLFTLLKFTIEVGDVL